MVIPESNLNMSLSMDKDTVDIPHATLGDGGMFYKGNPSSKMDNDIRDKPENNGVSQNNISPKLKEYQANVIEFKF